MASDKRELRGYWSKKERCLEWWSVRRCDGNLLHHALSCNPGSQPSSLRPNEPLDLPFTKELERRGYDMTTFRLTVKLRDDHAWVKRGALLYPQKGGLPIRVDWIRWRGAEVRVFLAPVERDLGCAPITQVPWGAIGEHGLSLEEVERDYQPSPPEPVEWSIDDLPPLWPPAPGRRAAPSEACPACSRPVDAHTPDELGACERDGAWQLPDDEGAR